MSQFSLALKYLIILAAISLLFLKGKIVDGHDVIYLTNKYDRDVDNRGRLALKDSIKGRSLGDIGQNGVFNSLQS